MLGFKELALTLLIILIVFGAGKLPLAFRQISSAMKSSKVSKHADTNNKDSDNR